MIYVLSKNKKIITFFHLKIIIFTAVKYQSILHRRVFVMNTFFFTVSMKKASFQCLLFFILSRQNVIVKHTFCSHFVFVLFNCVFCFVLLPVGFNLHL